MGTLIAGLIGLVVGAVVAGLVVMRVMPRMMIVTRRSRLGLEETVAAIQEGADRQGWSSPGTLNLNQSMASHDVRFEPGVRVVQLCKPAHAKEVLTSDRYVSSLMPCSIAVWEGDDGGVYVSKMNTGLVGRLFGGTIARVMGGSVAAEEQAILRDVVAR